MKDAAESTDLQQEVERLQGKLAQAASELQDFLYVVSHDFRGPLRAIMSASMILIEDHGDRLNGEAKAELTRQSEAAKKLNRLLEELLNLSRLNRQELTLKEIDLGQLAQAISSRRGLDAQGFILTGDLKALADEALVEFLLSCLIDNSIKFVQPGQPAKIEFGKDDEGFYFRDQGIGFEPSMAHRVFLPFEKLNGDDYPGMGIGLTKVKRIVSRHDGTVSASGNPNNGAEIRFTLSP